MGLCLYITRRFQLPLPLFKLLAICFHLSALLKNWKNTFFNFYSNLIMQWRKREPQLRRNSQVDIFPFWIWDTKLTKHLSLSLSLSPLSSVLFIHGKAMVPYVHLSTNCGLDNFITVHFFHCTQSLFNSWLTTALMVP